MRTSMVVEKKIIWILKPHKAAKPSYSEVYGEHGASDAASTNGDQSSESNLSAIFASGKESFLRRPMSLFLML